MSAKIKDIVKKNILIYGLVSYFIIYMIWFVMAGKPG